MKACLSGQSRAFIGLTCQSGLCSSWES